MQKSQRISSSFFDLSCQIFTKIALLFISFGLGLSFARFFKVPYANPYNISNQFSDVHFMPANNDLLLLFTVALTIGIFYAFMYFMRRWPSHTRIGLVAILALMVLTGMIAPESSLYIHNIDIFHHGEQLSPGSAFYNGKHLYDQIFFLHGAGEDAVLPATAFHLFGRSIGSYFFLTGLLQAVSATIFLFLLHKIIKQTYLFLAAAIWFLCSTYSAFFYIRDIFVWTSLLLIYTILMRNQSRKANRLSLASLGLLTGLAFFWSIDRALFLLLLDGIVGLILLFFVQEDGAYHLRLNSDWRAKKEKISALASGYILAFLLGLLVLGTSSFTAFVKMTFSTIPKFEGLMFDNPFPGFASNTWLTWFPIVVVILLAITLFHQVNWRKKTLTKEQLFASVLFVFGVIFLQAAAGMADTPHMAYATPALFVAAFYFVSVFAPQLKQASAETWLKIWPLALALVLMFTPAIFNAFRLLEMNQVSLHFTKQFVHLPSIDDSTWLPQNVADTKNYIAQHSTPKDSLFVFTSEPIYYYLTNRNNPSRFYITWFADPKPYTRELLASLKKNPPKFIVYQTGNYYDRPDFIPMAERIPEVNQWILANYPHTTTIDKTIEIRSR